MSSGSNPAGYQDYRLRPPPGSPGRFWFAVGFAIAAAVFLIYFLAVHVVVAGRDFDEAANSLIEGDLVSSEAAFASLAGSRFYSASARDGLGIVDLLKGDLAAAENRFASAGDEVLRLGSIPWHDLTVTQLDAGRYRIAEALARRASRRSEEPAFRMLRGMALNGLDRLPEARKELVSGVLRPLFESVRRGKVPFVGGILRDEETRRLYVAHVESLTHKERRRRRAYLLDREDKPIFQVSLDPTKATSIPSAFRSLAGRDGYGIEALLEPRDFSNHIETTIDQGLQRVAHGALKRQRGVIVILGVDGAVVAAAARNDQRRKKGAEAPDPFQTIFETASVAKIPTLAAALESPDAMEGLFPFVCDKPPTIGGRPFYDWHRHDQVVDEREALAVSCNLAFAELGLRLGADRLSAMFGQFGFGVPTTDPLSPSVLGELRGPFSEDRALAGLAVGIGVPHSTAVGAAAIALAVATEGQFHEPYVVRRKLSIGGSVYGESIRHSRLVMTKETAARIKEGMELAVLSPNGTARTGRPAVLSMAVKTGTSGSRRDGFNGVVVGFLPVESPRYAFAVYLPRSGRSSGVAVRTAKILVDAIHRYEEDRAPQDW